MSYAIRLHNFIENYNVLTAPTNRTNQFLRKHRTLYKIALLANHIFRATMMTFLLLVRPFGCPLSICFWLAGSIFYRLTVENNCAYKFALPSFAGGLAFHVGKPALHSLIQGSVFASQEALSRVFLPLLPLSAYFAYIALTVSYDVDHR